MNKKISFLWGAIGTGLALGVILLLIETRYIQKENIARSTGQSQVVSDNNSPAGQGDVIVEVEESIAWFPIDQMIDLSDAIFVGKVISVSPTQWNQDNGEPWGREASDLADYNTPFEIHYLELEVVQPIVNVVGLGKQVTVTVANPHPQDEGAGYLVEGEQVLLFALRTKISWREGPKEVLRITNSFPYGYFTLGGDNLYHGFSVEDSEPIALSLEQWISRVSDRRTLQTTP